MVNEERTKKEKVIADIDAKILSNKAISPAELRLYDKLKSELFGISTFFVHADLANVKWKIKKGRDSKRVTSFTRDRR